MPTHCDKKSASARAGFLLKKTRLQEIEFERNPSRHAASSLANNLSITLRPITDAPRFPAIDQ